MSYKEMLFLEAIEARKNAYAPYSQFAVGAALLSKEGEVFRGCNIENASSCVTICAERTAVFKAVSEGIRDFIAIAVAADTQNLCSPCGSCRQVLVEFNPEMEVIMGNLSDIKESMKAWELLPEFFRR